MSNTIELYLKRSEGKKSNTTTISPLYFNNEIVCYILEDKDRGLNQKMSTEEILKIKIKGQTAIPYGRYKIVITQSARFSQLRGRPVFLPLLLNVPGYEGIRIHTGVKPEDTEGCLLPVTKFVGDLGYYSKVAYDKLFPIINDNLKKGLDIFINIL